jgi:hypothetical protein
MLGLPVRVVFLPHEWLGVDRPSVRLLDYRVAIRARHGWVGWTRARCGSSGLLAEAHLKREMT